MLEPNQVKYTGISVLVEKLVFQLIRELCEEKRTVVGVGIGQKA